MISPVIFLVPLFFLIPLVPALIEMRSKKKDLRTFPDVTLYDDLSSLRLAQVSKSLSRTKARDEDETSEGLLISAGDVRLEDLSNIRRDIASDSDVEIGKLSKVVGSIKARDIHVHGGTVITGNIVATRNVHVEDGCTIRGLIWCGGDACLGVGVQVQAVSVHGECICLPHVVVREGIRGRAKYIIDVATDEGCTQMKVNEFIESKILVMISENMPIEEIQLRLLVRSSLVRDVIRKYLKDGNVDWLHRRMS